MAGTRNPAIDAARGLAIFIMLPANMAATVYAEPHPMWFRVFSSMAAPLFVALAGLMIGLQYAQGRHGLGYFLRRGALLLAVAALSDILLWNIAPFQGFDVLYLIAIACPLTFLFARLGGRMQLAVIAAIVLVSPVLQEMLGYTEYPTEYYLFSAQAGAPTFTAAHPSGTLQHLLIDGWFPLFPWLAISFTGAHIATRYFPAAEGPAGPMGAAALALLVLGGAIWMLFPGEHFVRAGYSEMFYPAVTGFLLSAAGFIMAVLLAAHRSAASVLWAPLRWLGEAALFFYLLHFALINFLIGPLFPGKELPAFLLVNFATLLLLIAVARLLHALKLRWPSRPFLLRFLLG